MLGGPSTPPAETALSAVQARHRSCLCGRHPGQGQQLGCRPAKANDLTVRAAIKAMCTLCLRWVLEQLIIKDDRYTAGGCWYGAALCMHSICCIDAGGSLHVYGMKRS
jgi:hypothetical protein